MEHNLMPVVFPVLHNKGITLRELAEIDLPAWFERLTDSESATLAGDPIANSMQDVIDGLEYHRHAFHTKKGLRWAIVPDHIGISVGSVGFNGFDLLNRSADIGYSVGRNYWNRGIATRAVGMAINYGFDVLDLERIEARVLIHNQDAIRVLEKVGFVQDKLGTVNTGINNDVDQHATFSLALDPVKQPD